MIVMFDSITVSTVPPLASASGDAVAGYIDGIFNDANALFHAFPHVHHLTIAVHEQDDAECADCETGDMTPAQAVAWAKRQLDRGVWRPCIYANLSTMPFVHQELRSQGVDRSRLRLWVAEWTFQPHIPASYDACQWTDHALGRNLDESLCLDSFFPAAPKPPIHQPKGVAYVRVSLNMATGVWEAAPLPGNVSFGTQARQASVELQINEHDGVWRLEPLPFDAAPLGA